MAIKRIVIYIVLTILLTNCYDDKEKYKHKDSQEPYRTCKLIPEVSNEHMQVEYCKFYDQDSSLIRKGFFSNGTAVKWHEFFSKGSLVAKREYLQAGFDSSILNRVYIFNENMDTNYAKSNFYTIKLEKDTFDIGDSIRLKVKFDAPLYRDSKAEVNIRNNNRNGAWVSPIDNKFINFSLIPHSNSGKKILQGKIIEYLINEDSSGVSRDLIIYEDYYVR